MKMKSVAIASFALVGSASALAAGPVPSLGNVRPLVGFLCTSQSAVVAVDFVSVNPHDPLSAPQSAHVRVDPRVPGNGVQAHDATARFRIVAIPGSTPRSAATDAFDLGWKQGALLAYFKHNANSGVGALYLNGMRDFERMNCNLHVRFGG